MLTITAVFTIAVPSVMDLNATHMTDPLWPPHARFHWAIQYLSAMLANTLALYLLWGNYREKDSSLALLFSGLAPMLFWTMFFPALLMPGTGTWPDGVTPPPGFPQVFTSVHPNFIMALMITALSVYAVWREMARRRRSADAR